MTMPATAILKAIAHDIAEKVNKHIGNRSVSVEQRKKVLARVRDEGNMVVRLWGLRTVLVTITPFEICGVGDLANPLVIQQATGVACRKAIEAIKYDRATHIRLLRMERDIYARCDHYDICVEVTRASSGSWQLVVSEYAPGRPAGAELCIRDDGSAYRRCTKYEFGRNPGIGRGVEAVVRILHARHRSGTLRCDLCRSLPPGTRHSCARQRKASAKATAR